MTKAKTPKEYVLAFRERGLTQVQIEERTGIPQSTISKIERGQIHDVLSSKYVALQALYAELYPDENCCKAR